MKMIKNNKNYKKHDKIASLGLILLGKLPCLKFELFIVISIKCTRKHRPYMKYNDSNLILTSSTLSCHKVALLKNLRMKLEKTGRESLDQLEASKRVTVETKMKESLVKCDDLIGACEQRSETIQHISDQSESFERLCCDVIGWLDACERTINELDTAPTTVKDVAILLEGRFKILIIPLGRIKLCFASEVKLLNLQPGLFQFIKFTRHSIYC